MTDLYFIKDHISEVTKTELAQNEILLDSRLFRLIQICENAKNLPKITKYHDVRSRGKILPVYETDLSTITAM